MYNKENISKEFLKKEYVVNNKTIKQISQQLNCSSGKVANKIRDFSLFKRKNISLVGKKFKKFSVLKRVENDKRGRKVWLCQCDCGEHRKKTTAELNSPIGISCGCEKYKQNSASKRWTGYGEIHGRVFYRIKDGAKKRKYDFNIDINIYGTYF